MTCQRDFTRSSERERRLKDLKIEYIESEIHVPNGKEAHFNPDRFNELYREGVEKLAAAREQDKDPYRQHSLVAARELDELKMTAHFNQMQKSTVYVLWEHRQIITTTIMVIIMQTSMNIRIRYYHTGDE